MKVETRKYWKSIYVKQDSTPVHDIPDEEVEQYFIAKNPHWQDALSLLKREDIRSLRLKPVGVYIACRQLVKFTGDELSLDIYYK